MSPYPAINSLGYELDYCLFDADSLETDHRKQVTLEMVAVTTKQEGY